MADRDTDHPSQKGWGAALKRRFTGASDGPGFFSDYREALNRGDRSYDMSRDRDPLATTLRGLVGTMIAAIPAMGVAFYIEGTSQISVDNVNIQQSGTSQTIGLNNGQHWTLVREGEEFAVYAQDGSRLQLVSSTAQALEAIQTVNGMLAQAITALEAGQLPQADIPQLLQYASISEAFVDDRGNIDRIVSGAAEDPSAQGRNLLPRLKAAQAFWQAGGQGLMTGDYGYDATERAALKSEENPESDMLKFGLAIAGLGLLLGVTAPFTLGAAETVGRRRRRAKGERNDYY